MPVQEPMTTTVVPFVDDGSRVMKRIAEEGAELLELKGIDEMTFFDIHSTVRFAMHYQARRLALQFPDSWLPFATTVVRLLTSVAAQESFALQCFVLADTSYGSCCVDRVAAQHCQAQMIVHYGDACLGESIGAIAFYLPPSPSSLHQKNSEIEKSFVEKKDKILK